MNRIIFLLLFLTAMINYAGAAQVDTMRLGLFGKVTIYKPVSTPQAFVLFVSGDGGWNLGVVDMAKNIVAQGAMVVGVDIQHYFRTIKSQKVKCYYPAGDFEELSLTLQKKYRFAQYMKPILVGYSSGATLVYGMLAQAPANTFKGAISMGFCPDIETDKTLCNGTGLTTHVLKEGSAYYLEASEKLSAPFIVLQGMNDKVCSYTETEKFMKGMHLGELVSLPNVGHGFSVTRNWLPQFIASFLKIEHAPTYTEKKASENTLLQTQHLVPFPGDLPLTIMPSSVDDTLPMAFMISGDGGWTSFDQTLGEQLVEKGISVVGLDAQKYFWNGRTPEQASSEISKAILHYMEQWNKKTFILAGYSFGACVGPFIANRFAIPLKHSLKGVFCLSPDETADFEIHIADMLELGTSEKFNVVEEIKKIKELNPVCLFGEGEDISVRNHFSETEAKIIILPGNHHYNDDFNAVAEGILKCIKKEGSKQDPT
jgi:type IV secretory pathway VirJ component